MIIMSRRLRLVGRAGSQFMALVRMFCFEVDAWAAFDSHHQGRQAWQSTMGLFYNFLFYCVIKPCPIKSIFNVDHRKRGSLNGHWEFEFQMGRT